MKIVYCFLVNLLLSAIGFNSLIMVLFCASKADQVGQNILNNCTNKVVWLRLTVGTQKLTAKRRQVVQLLDQVIESVSASDFIEKITEDLFILLKKERSDEVLEYLVSITGKLGIKDKKMINRLVSIFYSNFHNEQLCLNTIKAIKRIRPVESYGLVIYTIQNTESLTVFEKICQVPFYLGCEEKVIEDLVVLLENGYSNISLASKLRLVKAIHYVKNRYGITRNTCSTLKKWPKFSANTVNTFCKIIENERKLVLLQGYIELLLGTYSPKLYKLLIGFMNHKEVDLRVKLKVIKWLSFLHKRKSKDILLQAMKSKNPIIRVHSIRSLYDCMNSSIAVILLDQLVKNVDIESERQEIISILGTYAPLLKYEGSFLFYNEKIASKKYGKLRDKMIDTFQFVLNKMEVSSEKFPESKSMILDTIKLIRYLAYLKSERGYELLWAMLQYHKKKAIYLPKKVSHFYLMLYKQVPFYLLSMSSRKKLTYLYIDHATFELRKWYFPELPSIIFPYLSFPVKNILPPYESLPLLYTGKKKHLVERYPPVKSILELF